MGRGRVLTGWVRGAGDGGWVSGVVIGLDVRICERLVQAGDDGLEGQPWRGASESIGEDVSGGNLDALLEKVMFEDDETGA